MAKTDAATAEKKAPMTPAERKAAQRARERSGTHKTALTSRKQLNVTVPVWTTGQLEVLMKETGLTQAEIVARLIHAAAFQVQWLNQPVDGFDIPSDAPVGEMLDTWQARQYYSNHRHPTKARSPIDLRKVRQEERYIAELEQKAKK